MIVSQINSWIKQKFLSALINRKRSIPSTLPKVNVTPSGNSILSLSSVSKDLHSPQTDLNLSIGEKYTRKSLSALLSQSRIATSREGIVYFEKNALLFVTLQSKPNKKRDKRAKHNHSDYYEGQYFHWDSQTQQSIHTPKIKSMVENEIRIHLFARQFDKTSIGRHPFIYCGLLKYSSHYNNTANPVHIIFESIEYQQNPNDDLRTIYNWTPNPKTQKPNVSQQNPSNKNNTQRRGNGKSSQKRDIPGTKRRVEWNRWCTNCDEETIYVKERGLISWSCQECGLTITPHI